MSLFELVHDDCDTNLLADTCFSMHAGCHMAHALQTPQSFIRPFFFLQLGARALTTGFPNGAASVPIWLDNLGCTGHESTLFSCRKNSVGVHNCVHGEDAGVSCQTGELTGPPLGRKKLPLWGWSLYGGQNQWYTIARTIYWDTIQWQL